MKKNYAYLAVVLIFCLGGLNFAMAEEAATVEAVPQETVQQAENDNGGGVGENLYHMGRGVVNIGTCWLEVFRCMIYRNSEAPFWGFVAGAVEGCGFTMLRAFSGVTDILFLGFEPGNIFEPRFAEFVWDSPWIPAKDLQLQGPVLKED